MLALAGRPAGTALAALWYLGRREVDEAVIEQVRRKAWHETPHGDSSIARPCRDAPQAGWGRGGGLTGKDGSEKPRESQGRMSPPLPPSANPPAT